MFITNFSNDQDIFLRTDSGSGGFTTYVKCEGSTGEAQLYHYGTEKLATKSTGVDVTGNIKADTISIDHASNDWNFELDGADLIIKNGSTTLFKLDTSGNLTVAGDITTDGSL